MAKDEFTSRQKREFIDKVVKDGGFVGKNNTWHSVISLNGKLYRDRVETIILNGNQVFVKKKPNGDYYLPGGSTEDGVSKIDQAIAECHEEAHMNVKNVEATGITYKKEYDKKFSTMSKTGIPFEYYGAQTEIFIADYDSSFKGKIKSVDEDPFILSGKWYSTKECFSFFEKEHRQALLFAIKRKKNTVVTESYINNYFKNKKFLKKISNAPDIERSSVEQAIGILKKSYIDLISKSKIKREMKQDDVGTIFHPILSFDFPDKTTITVAICFDEHSFTDGAAFHTDEYGDIVVVYPIFFKKTKNEQVFTILHEIGHVRLGHLYHHNLTPFWYNDDTDNYRMKAMRHGKAVYPEVNADLYAVLNGASMYSILQNSFKKDADDEYDYRFTNQELANRYSSVFNQYKKLRRYSESTEDSTVNYSVTKYDIICDVLYEMVYFNEMTDHLNISEKNSLYNLIYEFAINNKIKDDLTVIKAEKEFMEAEEVLREKESVYLKYKNICESKISHLDISDIEFKLELESAKSENSDVIQIINELITFRERFEKASDVLSYAKSRAFDTVLPFLEHDKYLITPAHKKNEKAIFLACERNTASIYLHDVIDEMYETCALTKDNELSKKYLYLLESLSSKERSKIDTNDFGIPEERKYPLDTKKHVISAIKLFGHCDTKYRKELAGRILRAMERYDIPRSYIGENNTMRNYM